MNLPNPGHRSARRSTWRSCSSFAIPRFRSRVARSRASSALVLEPSVNASLRRLSEEGLVRAREAGRAYLYTLNREHLAAPAVELLADVRGGVERRLRDEIGTWQIAALDLSIFGSAARGDGDTASDIDVFVVRPRGVDVEDPCWREQLNQPSRHETRLDRQSRRALGGFLTDLRRFAAPWAAGRG